MTKRFLGFLIILAVIFMGCPDGGNGGEEVAWDDEVDVIIVGAGISGYTSLIAVKKEGAAPGSEWNNLKVRHIEKRSIAGGVTQTAGGAFAAEVEYAGQPGQTIPMQTFTQWRDAWQIFNHVGAYANWPASGNPADYFGYVPIPAGTEPKYGQLFAMYSQAQNLKTWFGAAIPTNTSNVIGTDAIGWKDLGEETGVMTEFNKRAIKLYTDDDGNVTGLQLQVYTADGVATSTYENIKAKKVILATGGYGNLWEREPAKTLEIAGAGNKYGQYFTNIANVES